MTRVLGLVLTVTAVLAAGCGVSSVGDGTTGGPLQLTMPTAAENSGAKAEATAAAPNAAGESAVTSEAPQASPGQLASPGQQVSPVDPAVATAPAVAGFSATADDASRATSAATDTGSSDLASAAKPKDDARPASPGSAINIAALPTATDSSAAGGAQATSGTSGAAGTPPVTSTGSTTASTAAASIIATSTPGNAAYKIGPLDVIEVSVFKVPDLSKSIQVAENGSINYPLIGEVQAAGKTAREIEQVLTRDLGDKYLQNPQVSVFVKEYNSQRVTIEGAVKKPGVYPMQGGMSLLQALAVAQGLDSVSDSSLVVFRTIDGKRSAARFDISQIRDGSAQDPQLQAGDIVVAGTSALKEGFSNVIKALPMASVFALL
ncbi:MAG: polysaccharide biosynthesis/export family protein [Hyphomicrobium sp.]|nr:polysaccharide biosynthesis/export family protein [Hyphomicrobium sp.]